MRHVSPARPLVALATLALAASFALTRPAAAAPAPAATWTAVAAVPETSAGAARTVRPDRSQRWALAGGTAASIVPPARSAGPRTLSLPGPDGGLQRFAVTPSTVLAPGLAAAHPEITTWAGRGVDDPAASVRVDVGSLGLHASVRSPAGAWYVDPYYDRDRGVYLSYWGRDLRSSPHGGFVEGAGDALAQAQAALGEAAPVLPAPDAAPAVGTVLRTYRLALLSDPTYAAYFGSENVLAAKVALVNRVDQVYEDDLSIRLVLIDQTDRLNLDTVARATGPDGPCGARPCFSPGTLASCTIEAILRNGYVLGRLVGASAYDVGHLALGTDGGGVAGLGVVGRGDKAVGCTGITSPVGDYYAVDYVAHELGHQFGGNHTFNGVDGNCSGGNRNAATSVEPGSGSSIMAYAGICGRDDLQPHSDPYFSERSLSETTAYTRSVQAPVDELQTVGLRGFSGRDSFAITFRGATTRTMTRGTGYTAAGIQAALLALPTVPPGSVTVTPFGGSPRPLDDAGFQVSFTGALAGQDVPPLGVVRTSGVTGSAGETRQGGPSDNRGAVSPTGNRPPVVDAGPPQVVPARTPFALSGSATDADGDVLTYLWEQNDPGGRAGTALLSAQKRNGPLFRQFGSALDAAAYRPGTYGSPGENATTTSPRRVFPDLAQVLSGDTNALTGDCEGPRGGSAGPAPAALVDCYSEFLPTADWVGLDGTRTMHLRLTARDGRPGGGGVASSTTTVRVVAGAGPFLVTAPAAGQRFAAGSVQQVRWDVAGTAVAPVGAAQVRITLSRDGGRTWPVVLADATANDGAAAVTIPAGATGAARVRVEAVGGVFFAVNAGAFAITG